MNTCSLNNVASDLNLGGKLPRRKEVPKAMLNEADLALVNKAREIVKLEQNNELSTETTLAAKTN